MSNWKQKMEYDYSRIPREVREQLVELDMELQEGDITEKGYAKKKSRLLQPYVVAAEQQSAIVVDGGKPNGGSGDRSSAIKSQRKATRRWTKEEGNRFHSEIRQEQVMRALELAKEKSVPLNFKRSSVIGQSSTAKTNGAQEDDSSDSESSNFAADQMEHSSNSSSMRTNSLKSRDDSLYQNEAIASTSIDSALQQQPEVVENLNGRHELDEVSFLLDNLGKNDVESIESSTSIPSASSPSSLLFSHTHVSPSTVSESNVSEYGSGKRPGKVSHKIQQLLATLKKPRRKNLEEYFEDDDLELEIAASSLNSNAPKPEGNTIAPFITEASPLPSNAFSSLEAALWQHARIFPKAPAFTVVDSNGRLAPSLTYGKLMSRSQRVCYNLLNKTTQRDGTLKIKPGDRVALVFPNSDPISFVTAFYGCLMAGVVPVTIEVPLSKRDAGCQQVGFLLGSCGVKLALTSESCFKSLPKTASNEVIAFRGWPPIQWLITTNLPKPPSSWEPPGRLAEDIPAYIEYTCDRDGTGSVLGVTVLRRSMINHCRSLSSACAYADGEVMICVVDFKRDVGLWHAILTSVYNRLHVICIPYALLKVSPGSWLLMITKFRAAVAVVKSRDLHWGVLAQRDHREVNLSQLRLLLIADGANPWSLTSCDQFLNVFACRGLRADAICPCASSAEALTVAVRRPGGIQAISTGRGVLSMIGLSYGVIRVDNDNSLTSLTLQDCGRPLADTAVLILKIDGPPFLCKTDEIGEICLHSSYSASSYWGLEGLTASVFKVQPLNADLSPYLNQLYVRTGLLGFLGPGGLAFVSGNRQGLLQVSGRKHSTDDIIATILAVEPMKFIYRGRIAVFSIKVLRDDRICVIAEQRPECAEDESFQWMSRVLQAVDSIHQVGIYCLALILPNHLPKTSLGGIHLTETRKRFLEGSLHPSNVLMCPHTCVTNLPKPRERHPDVGPASVMVGSIVQGVRLAQTKGRDLSILEDNPETGKKNQFITDILRWRSAASPEHVLFTLLNSKGVAVGGLTCVQLHKRAERVSTLLLESLDWNAGDSVALVFPPGLDLICAVHACLYIGVVPVTIRPPQPRNLNTTLPTVKMVVDISRSRAVITTGFFAKLMKSKEASAAVDVRTWPLILDWEEQPRSKINPTFKMPTGEMTAYLDFSVSSTGVLAGVKLSHSAVAALCRSMKLACEFYPSRHIVVCLDPYCGLGFVLWTLSSVFSGQHSILIPPGEVELNPALWITTVSQYRVRDTFCSYGVIDMTTRGLATSVSVLKERGISLGCVRTCVIVAEERPRIAATSSFTKLFSTIGLSSRAVSSSFGCRVNVALCLQGVSSPDPTTVYVDMRALRNDRVTVVERGAPHSLCLMESGKLLPGTKVVIANPDTKGQCGDSHLGEIWISSPFNSVGYYSTFGADSSISSDHFNARLINGDTKTPYARTGYLGFLRRTEAIGPEGEPHDAIFVVGALDETIVLRGMRFHPIDIENSVLKADKRIYECAIFAWTNLLVVTVELNGAESEALDLVPTVTNVVLEDHHLIVGIVVVADLGTVPINSRGEKQRMHLRDSFLADQLDPIYVAYNM